MKRTAAAGSSKARTGIDDGDEKPITKPKPWEIDDDDRHSDTVNPMPSAEAPAIRRRVAVRALKEARSAWRTAHKSPTEKNVRAAYRACVLAVRTLRRASEDHPDDEQKLLDEATLIDEAAVQLLAKLAVDDPESEPDSSDLARAAQAHAAARSQ